MKVRDRLAQKLRARSPRRGEEDGATAVEFAMVAGPLFFIIFSIMELGLIYMVSTTLENAIGDASRDIRTGEFQAANAGSSAEDLKAQFRTNICSRMSFLQDHCLSNISVDVRTLANFSESGGGASPVKDDGTYDDSGLVFQNSGEGARVLLRAYYRWPLVTPFLSEALVRADGKAVIEATVIHQNEPFGDGA
jgi:Flp pilus assembly protein TadG